MQLIYGGSGHMDHSQGEQFPSLMGDVYDF